VLARMGATMRHSASTASSRANRVASPFIASPRRRSYASISSLMPCVARSSTSSPTMASPGIFERTPRAMATSGPSLKRT
jgi:hypothetical protein